MPETRTKKPTNNKSLSPAQLLKAKKALGLLADSDSASPVEEEPIVMTAGTVTPEVENAVREYCAGKLEYRNDSGGNIHLPVGKVSFATADLRENIESVVSHMIRIKPASSKGTYIKRVCLGATVTPSVMLEVE